MLWPWEAHLAEKGFVVVTVEGKIEGALLASPDASPVGWMRLAAVGDGLDVGQWLDISLPTILNHLRSLRVRQLAWMDYREWAEPFLQTRGFWPLTEVITLTKTDRTAPSVDAPPVTLRPASHADFAVITTIDHRAFAPTWWRSEASTRRRAATASRFTVVEYDNRVIGYAEQELHPPTAHLNRIAVDPTYQGRGIGALLLKQVLVAMWRGGAETVSLNTQRSNHCSRRLYDRFGFEATGDAVTVWARPL
jgi:ribosomal protein S18 acetylase RimI-like enzyme